MASAEINVVDVKSVDIFPNNCPLGEELNVKLQFVPANTVTGHWELKVFLLGEFGIQNNDTPLSQYMVDMASKRTIIELTKTADTTYTAGEQAEVTLTVNFSLLFRAHCSFSFTFFPTKIRI